MTETPDRWKLDSDQRAITWTVAEDTRLPHEDHVEMSGRKVSVIVRYGADADGNLRLSREVIWPMLRTKPKDVRGYLRRTYGDEVTPRLLRDDEPLGELPPLARVRFDGLLTIEHQPKDGLAITRTVFPPVDKTAVIEQWTVRNVGDSPAYVEVPPVDVRDADSGVYGDYVLRTYVTPSTIVETLEPGSSLTFDLVFLAHRADELTFVFDGAAERSAREDFIHRVGGSLRLVTPDTALNGGFHFAKIRAAESIFDTAMGLVHSPGGGRYYGGVWANDQAEYAGPFFPFLGDDTANEASLNAYRIFARAMNPDYHRVPCSFEVEGDVLIHGRDRGDAAMIAYGASRFALALGDQAIAEELWPLIAWCLEYCRRKTNPDGGVVESDTDELEGRFPTGTANLSTSTLAYGGLRSAADLAAALGKTEERAEYDRRADTLRQAIETYFGATVEGFETYRYYDGNETLRAWICLPLTMGIVSRRDGTIAALFSPHLWTEDGLATEAGDKVFWDRATLYALRGVFAAGETVTALSYLLAYTRRRLLGDHVPYPVEAYPEGGQAHLSAESALYCRIITEGLFGITPTGLRSFRCAPRLPCGWSRMSLRDIRAFGTAFDLEVEQIDGDTPPTRSKGGISGAESSPPSSSPSSPSGGMRITVTSGGKTVFQEAATRGVAFTVNLGEQPS